MDKIKQLSSETAQFAKDIENEAKRITWPSRQEAIKSTLAVIVISGLFAAFLATVDSVFAWGIGKLLG
ncbi:MAG: preprotein translocase subunit SecE [Thermodesulfobacteriales bacterium]|nr:MAG: preprotein translocase subunit SecE [Thermodesulfobacteriales bacterium]